MVSMIFFILNLRGKAEFGFEFFLKRSCTNHNLVLDILLYIINYLSKFSMCDFDYIRNIFLL